MNISGIKLLLLAVMILSSSLPLSAKQAVKMGMSTALSGPAQEIGQQLKAGAELHLDHYNQHKPADALPVTLEALDDGYEPHKTVINARKLIYEHKVDALFGVMGTPTSYAIKPILEHSHIPLLMPYTGAEFLQNPTTFDVFNLRASYNKETQDIIHYFVDELKFKRIALLIQADEFGLTVEKGLTKALSEHGMRPVVITRFRRNSDDIDKALKRAKRHKIEAFAMVGTYQPLAKFINQAKFSGLEAHYATVSFASSNELFARLKGQPKVLVTEVVPDPVICKAQLCDHFRQTINQTNLPLNEQVFEGFLNAYLLTSAIQACQLPLQSTCLLNALQDQLENNQLIRDVFMLQPGQKKLPVYRSFF
ncbi:ABC transporter substrate-binding protein [Pseudoalteromonas sp. McH1-7]|uniref:ABC transporter substrate-binding protein n=1 Tax=Pseudoalteromonas TaxID=53246 RepID=UPI001591821C|nr:MULTISPECIES: ABC transporter substrate-binding protein [Pseudoalteromonas]MDW7550820.1 ABC transporter substrate-binding protein [Pseudoalteromonas peptidolytica]NUZ11402.1 ABC transporter substrate-binding protein [Pseudoalteromonas sp. McH1-7]USD28692.1 ABC transporter substrate-binding protein [Pseudoalteromonas sp. SCSIO 43201]